MISANGLQKLGFIPEVDFSLQDDGDGAYIKEWNSALPQPSVAEIEAAHAEWQTEHDSTEYQRLRAPEYPPIGDQLDAILKHLNYRRIQGDELIQGLDDIIGDWLSVKQRFAKND